MKKSFNMIFFYFSPIQGHVHVQLVVRVFFIFSLNVLENLLGLPLPFFLSATGASGLASANLKILPRVFSFMSSCCLIFVRGTFTFQSSMAALFSSLENCLLHDGTSCCCMVPDVQDSDLRMRSVKYPPDREFLSEADEILPAAA